MYQKNNGNIQMKTTDPNNIDFFLRDNVNLAREYLYDPRFFDMDYYNFAADKFVDKYSGNQDVISIYLFGQVSVAGISDLDFIVVLKEPQERPFGKEYSIMSFNEDLRYIYNNTQPFIVNEDVFKNFWKIFPTSNLKLIYGKDIRPKKELKEEVSSSFYNTLILIDVCNYFYPGIFLGQLFSKQLNVRYALLILNSLKFPLKMFMDISGSKQDNWIKFIDNVRILRESWFSSEGQGQHQTLIATLKEAIAVSLDLVVKLDSHLKQHLWTHPAEKSICISKVLGKTFVSPFNKKQTLSGEIREFSQTGSWRSFSPLSFYFPLSIYSQSIGVVSQHIKNHLPAGKVTFNVIDSTVIPYMNDRIENMNKHAFFYKANKIKLNMVHNYYGYNPLAPKGLLPPLLRKVNTLIRKFT